MIKNRMTLELRFVVNEPGIRRETVGAALFDACAWYGSLVMKWCFIGAVKQMCPRSLRVDLASCHSLLNTLHEYDTQNLSYSFSDARACSALWRLHCDVVLSKNQGKLTHRDMCGTRAGRAIACRGAVNQMSARSG